ncbi:hypothetical protein GUJ93_ZPchr2147g16410 [Zizania palustris]|uniref:Uncharacterized protein n=1 Tax=Zizania palustris TaxID=103762 RepID=A0A8J5VD68_ZIZPA|nr:hypothetical protein GUJ93_ZPchr2147g16410 [Zizania palustris]
MRTKWGRGSMGGAWGKCRGRATAAAGGEGGGGLGVDARLVWEGGGDSLLPTLHAHQGGRELPQPPAVMRRGGGAMAAMAVATEPPMLK